MYTYANKNILVLGAGVSGCGVAKVLANVGAKVILNDYKKIELPEAEVNALCDLGILVVTGQQEPALLNAIDRVIISPGIWPSIPIVLEAQKRHIPVVGEIEVAYDLCKAPIYAVTGTNGKTTTTMLLGAVFSQTGKEVRIGGNIGDSLSEQVIHATSDSIVVAELSSYQLETVDQFHPAGAIMLNITPDHLQRHGTMEAYEGAKENIFLKQLPSELLVLNDEDEIVRSMAQRAPGTILYSSRTRAVENGAYEEDGVLYAVRNSERTPVINVNEIQLRGGHNIENVLTVIALAHAVGVTVEQMHKGIATFQPVPHRIEPVRVVDGVNYYNDSKATNTDSVMKALDSFTEPVVLLLGGFDKMEDLASFMDYIKFRVVGLVLMGASRERFLKAAQNANIAPVLLAQNMVEAVAAGRKLAMPGGAVLLSPACSSFDLYRSFEERGDDFRRIVMGLQESEAAE